MADRKTPRRTSPKAAPPARRPISAGWAAAILAILVAIFFHEVLVGGQTFTSPDAMAPAGFVRMGEQSLWQDHVYPLWNPFVFLGMPSFASGAYNPLIYPPDWPLALLQRVLPLPEMTWLILYYAFGAWAFFLLAREWGARAEGALVGAIAFIFAPNLIAVGSHGHGSQLVDSAYLPFMLWLATRWLRGGKLEWLGMLAIAGGFQMLRGHVQVCFYTWLAIALYAAAVVALPPRGPDAAPRAQPVPRALALAAAAALAFGIAGLYNLPLQDYSHLSMRGAGEGGGIGMERATMWSLAPIELPTIVVPGWAGFGGQTYWGGMPFTDYPNAYVGMVTVLLALPAFLATGAARVFALALAGIALLIAFGHNSPVYGFLYAHLPLFNKFRIPVMVLLLFQLAACLGTAWGWSTVLDGRALAFLRAPGGPPADDRRRAARRGAARRCARARGLPRRVPEHGDGRAPRVSRPGGLDRVRRIHRRSRPRVADRTRRRARSLARVHAPARRAGRDRDRRAPHPVRAVAGERCRDEAGDRARGSAPVGPRAR